MILPAALARSGVRFAYYGDDFTGSTDTLSSVVQAGWRAALFMAVPDAATLAAFGELDCVGVAGTARAMSPAEMDASLPAIFGGLAATGAQVVHYKTCSTFDSAPHIGSIGHAVRLAQATLGRQPAMIVGGQPNLGRYCVFGNLFARAGQQGGVYRLDRHPTMSRHPVTPMDEADLARHLSRQGLANVIGIDVAALAADDADSRVDAALSGDPDALLFDVLDTAHLGLVGRQLWRRADAQRPLLTVGPTGVAQALLAARPVDSTRRGVAPASTGPVDQTLIVAGSRSPVTAAQIRHAEQAGFVSLPVDPVLLAQSGADLGPLVAQVLQALKLGRSVVAHTTFADDSHGKTAGFTRALAIGSGRLMQEVLARHPLRRVGLAGGDTSSLAVESWGITALTLSYVLGPGVGICRVHAAGHPLDGIELMLKGGQMGPPDVFPALLAGR
jgi:uncharacterized protein YgbK (DUF1537 family)